MGGPSKYLVAGFQVTDPEMTEEEKADVRMAT